MLAVRPSGLAAAVIARRPRAARVTGGQAARLREAHWLWLFEVGLPRPGESACRPYTVAEIAALFGLTPRRVKQGLRAARTLRSALDVLRRELDDRATA